MDGILKIIQPLWGSILQAETCQIFSLAEIQDGAESGNILSKPQPDLNTTQVNPNFSWVWYDSDFT